MSAEIVALIRRKAVAYATQQKKPEWADAFGRVLTAIAYGESGLRPDAVRDTRSGNDPLVLSGQAQREHSVGLFQLNFMGGRGNASGLTPEQARDPSLNIDASLAQLWGAFVQNGGGSGFVRDPITTTARTYQQGQGSIPPSIERQIKPGLALTSGGTTMPEPTKTTSGTTTKRTTTPQLTNLQLLVTLSKQRYDDAVARTAALRTRLAAITGTDKEAENARFMLESISIPESVKAESATLDDYAKATATVAKYDQETSTSKDPAGDARAQQKLNFDIIRAGLADQKGLADAVLAMLEYNARNAQAYVKDSVARGEMAREDQNTVFLAINARQTQKINSFIQGLASAEFISKARKDIVDRMLPPDTKYTFGPGQPLFETMRRAGMNPQPVAAVQIDRSYLEPEGILAAGQAFAPKVPSEEEYGITELKNIAAQNVTRIPWPEKPKPETRESLGLPAGLPYNIQEILDALNAQDQEEPVPAGVNTPEQQMHNARLQEMAPPAEPSTLLPPSVRPGPSEGMRRPEQTRGSYPVQTVAGNPTPGASIEPVPIGLRRPPTKPPPLSLRNLQRFLLPGSRSR